jgi:hypothetical protein
MQRLVVAPLVAVHAAARASTIRLLTLDDVDLARRVDDAQPGRDHQPSVAAGSPSRLRVVDAEMLSVNLRRQMSP